MFTFQRTAKVGGLEGSHSFGSELKSTPRRRSRSSTGARSVAVNYGSISLKTVPGPHVGHAILAAPHPTGSHTTTMVVAVAATTAVAVVVATDARSTDRKSRRAVAEACVARSEVSETPRITSTPSRCHGFWLTRRR
jgi:hypothetical protein